MVRALTEAGTGYEIVDAVGYTLVLPLVALLAASSVLGPEIDDGSIVYLLAKPVPRRVVVLSKCVVAWLATLAAGRAPAAARGAVLDSSATSRAVAWSLGARRRRHDVLRAVPRPAALTRHAVVIGLLFVLLWEGLLGNLLSGIRWLAIGAWGKEVASAVSDAVSAPGTGLIYALLAATLVTVGSVWFAGDRLRSFTLRGDE